MFSVHQLSCVFGDRVLFAGVDLQLRSGERYGITGANGTGKSTLLRLFAGLEAPSEGTVDVEPGARVGMLAQDHFVWDEIPILETVMRGHAELWQAIQDKEALLEHAHEHFDEDRYVELEDIVLAHDGYELEDRAREILVGLGIPEEQHGEPMSVLSGGYKLRALLGQVLCARPDALLLDEPTNHLDIVAIRWLEQFLERYAGCAVVVSHDIRFLNRICTRILDVDYQTVTEYPGNYDAFEQAWRDAAALREQQRKKAEAALAAEKRAIANLKASGEGGQARARRARLAELAPPARTSRRRPRFELCKAQRPGRIVLTAEGLCKAYGDRKVIDGLSFDVERGERLAIIGANGVGKSTLLKMLVGELAPDAGHAEWGYRTEFAYFPQDHHEALGDPDQTVRGAMWAACPEDDLGGVMGRLAQMLFTTADADKQVQHLSGGEAARLLFACIGLARPEVLVLDEPTNHLDIDSIRALVTALQRYDGTLILVSHDRWFVDRLATRVIEIRPGRITDHKGRYGAFVAGGGTDHLARKGKKRRKGR